MREAATTSASKMSLEEFRDQVCALRRLALRTFVVLSLFASPRRTGNVEEWATKLARQAGLAFFFCSVDLLVDSRWDL